VVFRTAVGILDGKGTAEGFAVDFESFGFGDVFGEQGSVVDALECVAGKVSGIGKFVGLVRK
jgi:hypothetical protein